MDEIEMKNSIEMIIEWNGNQFDISISLDDTVYDLKRMIANLTNLQPNCQHFPDLTFPVHPNPNACKIKQLNLIPKRIIEVVDITQHRQSEERNKVCASPTEPHPFEPSSLVQRELKLGEREFKWLNKPRSGKKLAVLDVDNTIYDCAAPHRLAARPYLEEFLISIYEDYDIGIWSATNMSVLKSKMKKLGMNAHSKYKLLFYMDKYSTGMAFYKGCMVQVKPLEMIWTRLPEYNKTNTIMCDDLKLNFCLTPKNGITVTAYSYKYHNSDEELKHLSVYLKSIAQCTDVTEVNHDQWRTRVNSDGNDDGNNDHND